MSTRILPTDKTGKIYYGPRSYAAAAGQIKDGRPAKEMANMMEGAGYIGIARKIRREYGLTR